jgi:hypothetical protein
LKMYEKLEDGGTLVSIMSRHWINSSNKKETAFKEWLRGVGYQSLDVDAGEFKESGTSIATIIVIIIK